MVDFKELSAHTKRSEEWARRWLNREVNTGHWGEAEVKALAKQLRDAWHQGKLGRKLQQEDQ